MPNPVVVYLESWGVTTHPHYPASEPCPAWSHKRPS